MITIKKKTDCSGCEGCYSICPKQCITMEKDQEGFCYPKVDDQVCIQCGKCVEVCPIIHKQKLKNQPIAYACINVEENIRMESSSGGIFTLIAEQIISEGGVVFGAGFTNQFEVEHSFVEKKEDLYLLRGSKYVQSKIGDTYKQVKEFLNLGRKVLFSGTPCQIAGLKSYLRKAYDNLFTMDFICHGVPSSKVWRKYISYQEGRVNSIVKSISFRRKDEGWKQYFVSFRFENEIKYRKSASEDLYMRAFLKDVCLRPSCYECEFKTLHRQSDITMADFWGIENVLPEMDDNKGTSLILVHSDRGKEIFERVASRVLSKTVDIHEAVKYNTAAIKSAKYNPNRVGFMKEIDSLPIDKLVKKYCKEALKIRVKRKVKRYINVALIKSIVGKRT